MGAVEHCMAPDTLRSQAGKTNVQIRKSHPRGGYSATAKGVFLDKVATLIQADDVKHGTDGSAMEKPSAAGQEPWNLMSSCLAGSRLFWDYVSACCWRPLRPPGTCQPASVSSFDKALNRIHSVSHGRLHYSLSTT